MTRMKECPLLKKFYVPPEGSSEDWMKWVCRECCPEPDRCIFDIVGRVPPILIEKLENATIPCPHCQKDAVYVKQVKTGEKRSGLYRNEDGDWACYLCGWIIYKTPILYKSRKDKGKSRGRPRKVV